MLPLYLSSFRQCTEECPMGTTAFISKMLSELRTRSAHSVAISSELRCERCFSACAECLRPYSAHGCTACTGDSYLAPFISPSGPDATFNSQIARLLALDTSHGDRLLIGSCVSRCPIGYFANKTSKICMK